MQWKDLGKVVGEFAPMLGDLLPIPGAGIAGKLIAHALGVDNAPDAIHAAIQNDPDAAVKIAKIEADHKEAIQAQLLAAETARITSVNKTMQAETKSEHWAQWLWRPYNGFLFGTTLFMVYALPSIINTLAPAMWAQPVAHQVVENGVTITKLVATWIPIKSADVPEFVFVAWGGVLGITAWHRGKGSVGGNPK